ncbi:MAG: ABC transporter ATP-binding protein, partial [Pseudomonadota bacterium]
MFTEYLPHSLTQTLLALVSSLLPRRRMQLALLLGLMLVSAVAEVVSLGAILPFLAILVNPQQALQTPLVVWVVATLGLGAMGDLRWQLTLLFAATAVVAGVVRFALIYTTARLNFGIGHELGAEIYLRTLYQPYEVHVARNSSEIMGGINKVDEVVWVVFALLNLTSASLMAVFIVIALLLINTWLAVVALLSLGSIYAIVFAIARKQLIRNSQVTSRAFNKRVQTLQEGLGGIRDVLLDHTQTLFARRFNEIDWPMRQAQASNNIIGPSPRFAVEALGMVLIVMLAYTMATSSGGLGAALPALGALALGIQRLMPLIQQTYQGWVKVSGNRQLLHDVIDLLKQPMSEEVQMEVGHLPFEREICLEQVSFRYQSHLPFVLQGVNLTISKGARVGFVGTTGSGKSTAMDLLMGLLQPTDGRILVDGTPLVGTYRLSWQRNIAHVPQAIYLADASFAENIAFGRPVEKIDLARVMQAANQAQINEFIEATPDGYQTTIGERGVRLSGGQRQRIGIARALYRQAKLLVFDEATSALDSETEAAVISSIQALGRDLTILMIAHRVSTLKDCDMVVEIRQG